MSTALPRYCCAIDGRLANSREGLLPHGREDLQVMVDAAQLVGDLDEAQLREVPDVRRQLAGDARADRGARRAC